MPLVHVQSHDLLEELVQSLVGVGDDEGPLLGEAVVDVGDDLHGHVGLARAWRAHDHGEAWAHACTDGFDLENE